MDEDLIPKIIGGAIGLALAGYFLVYQPMSRNYAECGKVTLCTPTPSAPTPSLDK